MAVFVSWDIDGTLIGGGAANHLHHTAFAKGVSKFVPECPDEFPSGIFAYLGGNVPGQMDSNILRAIVKKATGGRREVSAAQAVGIRGAVEEWYSTNVKEGLPPAVCR
jgi:hypothetical protein